MMSTENHGVMMQSLLNYFMHRRNPMYGGDRYQKRSRHGSKRARGILDRLGGYNKAIIRAQIRESKRTPSPATPTSSTFRDGSRRKHYRVWSDGSYRLMQATGRRTIMSY
jgi:hypothetical protein